MIWLYRISKRQQKTQKAISTNRKLPFLFTVHQKLKNKSLKTEYFHEAVKAPVLLFTKTQNARQFTFWKTFFIYLRKQVLIFNMLQIYWKTLKTDSKLQCFYLAVLKMIFKFARPFKKSPRFTYSTTKKQLEKWKRKLIHMKRPTTARLNISTATNSPHAYG